jgi:predicted transcriptional regulator
MAVISIRLNQEEEKMLDFLADYFEEDRSTLVKHSLVELFEDLKDREVIEAFEKFEKKSGKKKFVSSDDILKQLG